MLDGPLYLCVRDALIERLTGRVWRPGAPIPPEPSLADEFACSIGTLRKAIDGLCQDGVLVRRQGSGTYVRNPSRDDPAETLGGLCRVNGQAVSLALLRQIAATEQAAPRVARALACPRGAEVLRVERMFVIDEKTRLHETLSIPASRLGAIDLHAPLPLWFHAELQERYGLFIASQRPTLGTVEADPSMARRLRTPEGTCLYRVETLGLDLRDEPVEHRLVHVPSAGLTYRPPRI